MVRYRKQRVSEMLKEFLSTELLSSHHEALRHVSLCAVEVTPDLKEAKIYWVPSQAALIGLEQQPDDAVDERGKKVVKKTAADIRKVITETLKDRRGELRTAVAHGLNLRHAPELDFRYDESIERGSKIEELLKKAGL